MTLKLTILGCGNSTGTPATGNYWGQCDPEEPRNYRTRQSALVQSNNTTILIDTTPDCRQQLNRMDVKTLDAVLYTHAHGDHVHGIDDVRIYRLKSKKILPMYGNKATVEEIQRRFDYLFETRGEGLYPSVMDPYIIEENAFYKPMTIGDIEFIPIEQDHGFCKSLGFRFGDIAYCTDVMNFGEKALDVLKGVKHWVIDGAAYKQENNPVHFKLKDVYRFQEIVQAERLVVTHLSPAMDYQTLAKELPDYCEPAYDGLEIIAA